MYDFRLVPHKLSLWLRARLDTFVYQIGLSLARHLQSGFNDIGSQLDRNEKTLKKLESATLSSKSKVLPYDVDIYVGETKLSGVQSASLTYKPDPIKRPASRIPAYQGSSRKEMTGNISFDPELELSPEERDKLFADVFGHQPSVKEMTGDTTQALTDFIAKQTMQTKQTKQTKQTLGTDGWVETLTPDIQDFPVDLILEEIDFNRAMDLATGEEELILPDPLK